MIYSVAVANGETMLNRRVLGVASVKVNDGIYILFGKDGTVLFSSPVDSLVYLEAE